MTHRQPRHRRLLASGLGACLSIVSPGLVGLESSVHAQAAEVGLPPAALESMFADPLVDFDVRMTALDVTTWKDGDARMMLLRGDASLSIGAYGFNGSTIVVRIENQAIDAGTVRHIAAWFQDAQPVYGIGSTRAGLQPRDGRNPLADGARQPGLLVTSSTLGKVRLEEPGDFEQLGSAPAEHSAVINQAMQRLADHRRALQRPGLLVPESEGLSAATAIRKQRRRAQIEEEQRRLYDAVPGEDVAALPEAPEDLDDLNRNESILPASGVVAYAMDSWSAQIGDEETAISLVGDVQLVFEDFRDGRVVTLRAERVVLFVSNDDKADPFDAAVGQLEAGALRGVYLEDNAIVSDGTYTVRAPRMFYDLARNRATLLDAVFYAFDTRRQVPLYVRADSVRQTSATDFLARDARLTTSEFATPHFSIGAGELSFQQVRRPNGEEGSFFTARDTTLNVGDTPVFYWPELSAYGEDSPLRSLNARYSSNDGVEVETTWDLFAMLGKTRPDNVDAEFNLDYLGEHGPGIGTSGNYDSRNNLGEFRGYLLVDDSGEDEVGGREINQEDEIRGVANVRHREYLPGNFELTLEGAFVSDPTFLEAFYPSEAAAGKLYETSAYLKWQEEDQALDFLASTNLSGFVEQLDELQSQGYYVERYPELSHRVIGGSLLGNQMTWYSQTSFSQLRIVGEDDTPGDRGFNDAQSQQFFGINANQSFSDRLDAAGFPEQSVRRFDSRQELSLPMASGPLDITPYVVGRFTAYDEDFVDFGNTDGDQVRLWGAAGLRLGTQFSKADGSVQSSLLDVDGIRHIIEPGATLFLNGSTIDPNNLPEYDDDVEILAEGAGVKLGMVNTWQTRRGGPGRERTVDWITLQTDLVFRSDDADVETDIARFYDYRPEYSVGGDHFYTELLWMVTDTLGVAGQLTHSFESDRVAQWRVGGSLDHTPRLNSFVSYEEIDVLDNQLLTWGFGYHLTTKYRLGFQQTLDFSENDSRQIDLVVDRQLPRWTLRIKVGFDEIDDEQTIGFTLIPDGRDERSAVFGF
ncbi:MAG: hypothetical protein AAGA25_00070 [Planctomycetota bacterium]